MDYNPSLIYCGLLLSEYLEGSTEKYWKGGGRMMKYIRRECGDGSPPPFREAHFGDSGSHFVGEVCDSHICMIFLLCTKGIWLISLHSVTFKFPTWQTMWTPRVIRTFFSQNLPDFSAISPQVLRENWGKLQAKLEFSIQNLGKLQVKPEFCQAG